MHPFRSIHAPSGAARLTDRHPEDHLKRRENRELDGAERRCEITDMRYWCVWVAASMAHRKCIDGVRVALGWRDIDGALERSVAADERGGGETMFRRRMTTSRTLPEVIDHEA